MKPKSWDPKTKARIILEGLRGRPVSEICSEYGVHNSQYYDWRDKFLKNVEKVFENGQSSPRELRQSWPGKTGQVHKWVGVLLPISQPIAG